MKSTLYLVGLLVLTGCNTYHGPRPYVSDPSSVFTGIAANQTVSVRTLGAPAGISTALQTQVINGLEKSWSYLNARFVPASGPAGQDAELVFAFNAGIGNGDAICAGEAGDAGTATSITTVSAAFCQGDTLTEIHAEIPPATSANDANLKKAIEYLAWQVVPAQERAKNSGNGS